MLEMKSKSGAILGYLKLRYFRKLRHCIIKDKNCAHFKTLCRHKGMRTGKCFVIFSVCGWRIKASLSHCVLQSPALVATVKHQGLLRTSVPARKSTITVSLPYRTWNMHAVTKIHLCKPFKILLTIEWYIFDWYKWNCIELPTLLRFFFNWITQQLMRHLIE